MKSKLPMIGLLLASLCAKTLAQIPITTNMLPPVVGPYDQAYLPGAVSEATQAMAPSYGYPENFSGDNDVYTYVAGDKASKGQTFTTGPNPSGYILNSVTVRHIFWGTNFLSNGTYMSIPTGAALLFRFGTISGTTITSSILTTNAVYSGTALNMAGGSGTGIYFTFSLAGAGIGTLAPNTTYFFELASSGNPPYFELHNTGTNVSSPPFPPLYTNGTAFYGDTLANLDQSLTVNLPPFGGEFAFDANLAAVGAPSVAVSVSPSGALDGQPFTVTATVTPGLGTVTNVSVNLSGIGGPAAASLVLSSANVYTNTFTIPVNAPAETTNLAVTVIDTTPLKGSGGTGFTVLPNSDTWDGGSASGNNWSDAANWLGNLAPSLSGNTLTFAGTTRLTPNMDNNYSVSGLVFSNTAGNFTIGSSVNGTLTVGSGGIQDNSAGTQTLNVPVVLSAPQSFNVAGSGLILNSNVLGGVDIIATGGGAVTFDSPGTNVLEDLDANNGQVNISTGTVNVTDASGNQTMIENNSSVVVSGATLNIVDGGNGWLPIGVTAGGTGSLVLNSGAINVLDHWGTEVGNNSGQGILIINGGTFLNNDIGAVGLLIADGASPGGTINLNGGFLIVNHIGSGAGAGGNVYLNGGTLEPIASNAGFWTDSPIVNAYVRNGGVIVNTLGFNITIAQPLQHSNNGGDNAEDGGLAKLGTGILSLSGGYSYTGPNSVLGGTLSLSLAQVPATGGDLVVSNATLLLDASGGTAMPAGNVTLNAANLDLTNSASASTISGTGNLTISSNIILNLNYGELSGSNPGAAVIAAAGTVSVTGQNNVINITGTGFTVGQFPLLKYGSGSLASISGFTLGTLPPGVNGVLVNNTGNKSVDLNIQFIGQTLTWYGASSGGSALPNWDINTSANWNSGASKYLEYNGNTFGDLVTFDDTLDTTINPPSTNVILTTVLDPSKITMNNSTYPYTFSGPGSLTGSGSLTLNGSSSLTLTTSNQYSGGTFINAGTLVITNDNELGISNGPLTLNGGTLQIKASTASIRPLTVASASTVDVVTGVTAQFSGPISGPGDWTLPDFGMLTFSPAQTNAIGDLDVRNGQVNVASGTVNVTDASGTLTMIENNGVLVVSGGTLNIFDGGNGWFPIGVTAGATGAVVVAGGTINVLDHWGTEVGNNSGSGLLTINSGTYLNRDIAGIGLLIADASSPGGTINLNGGLLIVNSLGAGAGAGGNFYFNGGTLEPVANNGGFWNNSAKITASVRNGGASVNTAGFNVTIGQPLLHSTVVGDSAIDGGLTKAGAGTLSLAGADSYNGNTVINGGVLNLAQSAATLAAGSTVKIASGAQLELANSVVTNTVASFVLNGVTNHAGLYTSANSSGYITGPGYLLVTTGSAGPSGPGTITNSFSAGVLKLSWPAGQGWRLQVQTNSMSKGLGTNWVYLSDGTVSSTNITVNPASPTVFFRLTYP